MSEVVGRPESQLEKKYSSHWYCESGWIVFFLLVLWALKGKWKNMKSCHPLSKLDQINMFSPDFITLISKHWVSITSNFTNIDPDYRASVSVTGNLQIKSSMLLHRGVCTNKIKLKRVLLSVTIYASDYRSLWFLSFLNTLKCKT